MVAACVAALTGDPAHDEIAYVVVPNASEQSAAELQFQAAGADLSKVQFITLHTNTVWIRDYGPHYIWQDGVRAVVDSHYYPGRPDDNFLPTLLADDVLHVPSYDIGLYYSGGNFQAGPNRTGFTTSLVHTDNPDLSDEFIAELYRTYQGIDTLYILPRLPAEVDLTGHLDMWFYLVDPGTVVIAEYPSGSNPDAITITNETAAYMESVLGYEVIRVPGYVGPHGNFPQDVHYTYANAFRVNDRIFIPSYGQGDTAFLERDAQALAAWQAAAPEAEIIPIDCYDLIPGSGALHCMVKQVPRYESASPSACVLSPDGGELLVWGTNYDITWAATDDQGVSGVDLYFSVNGGWTYEDAIAVDLHNDGHFAWTVPHLFSTQALIRVVVHDAQGHETEAVSSRPFVMSDGQQHVYDFSSGAGVNRWGWGYQTLDWSDLDGTRRPLAASTEISELVTDAYAKLAYADADGPRTDPNRYSAPIPSSTAETTHIFEFTIEESPEDILDIGLSWEGYADSCLQMELYVWDYVAQQWSNHLMQYGENRYVDNRAGNRDAVLSGHLRSSFGRYLGPDGLVTLLLYGERPNRASVHDYVSVTVTYGELPSTIPTISDWGVVAITLFLLTCGTLVLRKGAVTPFRADTTDSRSNFTKPG